MRTGNKLVDFNWRLDLQVATEAGKSNLPQVLLQMESISGAELGVERVRMRGEQFMAFFGNLKKIRENLLDLVEVQKDKE